MRELEDITVVFKDRQSIYVYPKRGIGVCFNRWYAPKGSYADWYEFRKRLMYNRRLDLWKCYKLAEKRGIKAFGTVRRLDLSTENIVKKD